MTRIATSLPVLFIVCLATSVLAGSDKDAAKFSDKHQAGIRLGAWVNQGDLPPEEFPSGSLTFFSDITKGSLQFEGFVAYRLTSRIWTELAIGLVNRGDVRLQQISNGDTSVYFGNLNIYPIIGRVKFYMAHGLIGKFHPYLTVGGGLFWAKHDLFAAGLNSSGIRFIEQESALTASVVLGGGVDWPVASMIGLEINADYMPITYSDGLLGSTKWSGLTVTLGVKYIFEPDKKNDHRTKKKKK